MAGERASPDCASSLDLLRGRLWQGRRRTEERDLDVPRDQIVDRLARAAIGHVVELDVRGLVEPLHQHMLVRTDARRRAADARLLLHRRDQFGDRIRLERRVHRKHGRLQPEQAHRHHILQVVDAELLHMRRAHDVVVRDEEIVAVRAVT